MKIFIDFDDAIFNTKKFKQDLIGIFKRHGVTEREFKDTYYTFSVKSQSQGRHYDLDLQIKALEESQGVDGKKLKTAVDKFMNNLDAYVFPDVKKFLQKFSRKDLFILSYGQPKFQKSKIRGTGIEKMASRIFITKRKKINVILELARKYAFSKKETILLIDDHPDQFELSEKAKGRIMTLHLCRKEGRYRDLPCERRDYVTKDLMGVAKIIKKEKMH
jgi:hypothetical protein